MRLLVTMCSNNLLAIHVRDILVCDWLGPFLRLFFVNRTNICTSPILRNNSLSVCLLKDNLKDWGDG